MKNSSQRRASQFSRSVLFGAMMLAGLGACAQTQLAAPALELDSSARLHPEIWPTAQSGVARDPAIEAEVERILAQMTLEDKVGQIIQADVNSVTPEEVERYRLGSVLNGGNSGPGGDDRALAPAWLDYADRFYDASMRAYGDRVAIPVIWGSDSVHGNANIIGATIFPHNIGLGAMRNPELMERIGEITALETRITGQDWTFAPTIAVVRDDRWGRTYEGYSEEPGIVTEYAPAIVRGIQGDPSDADFLRGPHIIATAKHYLGDGGTMNGVDQGDNQFSEEQFRDLFSPGYPAAIEAGVQSVMASYNSYFGVKSHGNEQLLSDILIDRFGLEGFVVGDWNGHGQVEGCTATDCAASFNAGLDMFMAPDTWRGLYDSTLEQARSGEIPTERLDEAVARILRVKLRAGLFEVGRPSERPFAGQYELLGSAEHRAVARQAVRESLVLLKNENSILPLAPSLDVLVVGSHANSMENQTGGWTISWQGTGNARTDFPNAQTIFEAIEEQVEAAGGTATLSVDGAFDAPDRSASLGARFQTIAHHGGDAPAHTPDVAIVVFGETPYAEFQGDRDNVDYQGVNRTDLALIERLKSAGVPVVSVFLSGRPLYVTPEINASDAFVAAWLPGSEGGGVADVLFRDAAGAVQHDFSGKLSFSWPRSPVQTPLNIGDADYDPLFAFGFGMTYAAQRDLGALPLAAADASSIGVSQDVYFADGAPSAGWGLFTMEAPGAPPIAVTTPNAASGNGALTLSRFDRRAQEDAIRAVWNGEGFSGLHIATRSGIDVSRQANGELRLMMEVNVETAPTELVWFSLATGCDDGVCPTLLDISALLPRQPGWAEVTVPLSCFGDAGADLTRVVSPFGIGTSGRLTLGVTGIRLVQAEGVQSCPPALY